VSIDDSGLALLMGFKEVGVGDCGSLFGDHCLGSREQRAADTMMEGLGNSIRASESRVHRCRLGFRVERRWGYTSCWFGVVRVLGLGFRAQR